jgi:hypothetical protein
MFILKFADCNTALEERNETLKVEYGEDVTPTVHEI